jgi:hypothetical protein
VIEVAFSFLKRNGVHPLSFVHTEAPHARRSTKGTLVVPRCPKGVVVPCPAFV